MLALLKYGVTHYFNHYICSFRIASISSSCVLVITPIPAIITPGLCYSCKKWACDNLKRFNKAKLRVLHLCQGNLEELIESSLAKKDFEGLVG